MGVVLAQPDAVRLTAILLAIVDICCASLLHAQWFSEQRVVHNLGYCVEEDTQISLFWVSFICFYNFTFTSLTQMIIWILWVMKKHL